jgi:hypothetical protein
MKVNLENKKERNPVRITFLLARQSFHLGKSLEIP